MNTIQNPSFDTWTSVFLIFSTLAGVIAILLFIQSILRKQYGWMIGIILLIFSLTLFDYVLFWTGYIRQYPYFVGLTPLLYFLYGPILYLYIRLLGGTVFRLWDIFHFLPFVILLIWKLPIILLDPETKMTVLSVLSGEKSLSRQITILIPWFSILHMAFYSVICGMLTKTFNEFKLIRNWTIFLSLSLLGLSAAYLSYMILAQLGLITSDWDYMISLVMVLCILGITAMGFLQPAVFNDIIQPEKENSDSKYEKSALTTETMSKIALQLQNLMQKEQLWRKSDLRLEDLSQRTGFPRHLISQVLNDYLNINFFNFVNSYRVQDAIQLFQTIPSTVPAIEIGFQAGFNNKVSFTKAFRAVTGKTPTEFRFMAGQKVA